MACVDSLLHRPDSALARHLGLDWSAHEENTARLYEVLHYGLQLTWADRTVDPDDPEVRRRRMQDERNGVRPPKAPILPPVAVRPAAAAERARESYLAELAAWTAPVASERVMVDSDEFDRILGLDSE
ncbi:hypothetical protein GCM10022243_48120 [Saccharothrix violaceirubra]|uniref:Uncharacterized protein n=1 Tax=Saccharothrix violaceirubra TaxID=413306 RepID=A0A7W7SZI9_9PSEU|nr:hypothetical protein [Saccharothrix violaceirubra]MBB4963846.1 hypothetical protein [Saccharothrix violaceirubra]